MQLLLPLLIGITIGLFTPINEYAFLLTIAAIVFLVVSVIMQHSIGNKPIKSILFSMAIFCIGAALVNISKQHWLVNHYKQHLHKNSIVIAKILEPTSEKKQSYKTIAEIVAIKNGDTLINVCGKVVMYFAKCIEAKNLGYADVVVSKNNVQDLRDAPNPHEFSPKDYLGYRGIYQSCYLKNNNWKKLPTTYGSKIKIYCYQARNYCLKTFKQYGLDGDEYAVASAMIVGFEDELRPEIISFFSASGAMHLLSVSGLHISFVYIILAFFMRPLSRFKHGKKIEFVITVFILWFYAIVTGFSAPVVRSAIMFSFVVYAKSFDKYLNMTNILALAGFFILAIDPLSIADVGFQLSFLALLSILVIQPIISEIYYSKNYFKRKAWEITSVSISATMGTLPLTFFYFHQFPNYFILVNLIVIPLSTILLITGFVIVMFSWLPPLAMVLTIILKYITMFLNYILKIDENLPGSVTTSIQINAFETCLFFVAIVFFCVFLYSKNNKHILLSLSVFLLFIISGFAFFMPTTHQRKLTIYSIKSHVAIDFFSNNKTFFISDSILQESIIDLRFHVFPNRIHYYIKKNFDVTLNQNFVGNEFIKSKKYIQFYGKRLVILDSNEGTQKHVEKLNCDYLLLVNSCKPNLKKIIENYNFKTLILDASMDNKLRKKILRQLKEQHQNYWDALKDGAFIANL